jgi:hypothetical protein
MELKGLLFHVKQARTQLSSFEFDRCGIKGAA